MTEYRRNRVTGGAYFFTVNLADRRSDLLVHEQRRFWEHTVRDESDYAVHLDCIRFNPVKHGLVADAGNWPYSSFHRCVRMGLYPPEWTGGPSQPMATGERSSRVSRLWDG